MTDETEEGAGRLTGWCDTCGAEGDAVAGEGQTCRACLVALATSARAWPHAYDDDERDEQAAEARRLRDVLALPETPGRWPYAGVA